MAVWGQRVGVPVTYIAPTTFFISADTAWPPVEDLASLTFFTTCPSPAKNFIIQLCVCLGSCYESSTCSGAWSDRVSFWMTVRRSIRQWWLLWGMVKITVTKCSSTQVRHHLLFGLQTASRPSHYLNLLGPLKTLPPLSLSVSLGGQAVSNLTVHEVDLGPFCNFLAPLFWAIFWVHEKL